MSSPITFKARDGRELVARDPLADNTDEVLTELAWAHTGHQHICEMQRCPADQGGYCLECHMVAAEARDLVSVRQTGEPYPNETRVRSKAGS